MSNPLFVLVRSNTALELGLVVPTPTLTLLVALFTPLTEPNTRQLSQSTRDFAPIAVALFKLPVDTFAPEPIPVF